MRLGAFKHGFALAHTDADGGAFKFRIAQQTEPSVAKIVPETASIVLLEQTQSQGVRCLLGGIGRRALGAAGVMRRGLSGRWENWVGWDGGR